MKTRDGQRLSRVIALAHGGNDACIHRRCYRNGLEGRSQLIHGKRNIVAAGIPVAFDELVGIENRQRRHGDDFTRVSRSEEHTSELQSLMRISYAVFCLKKKKKNSTQAEDHE